MIEYRELRSLNRSLDNRPASCRLPVESSQKSPQRFFDIIIQTVNPTRCEVAAMRNGLWYRAFACDGTPDRLPPIGADYTPPRKYHSHDLAYAYSSNHQCDCQG
jgi:hypothetical protein